MNSSWHRAAVTLAVVALGLTACGDKDEPTQSSSPTPTASASVSSSSASPSASASPSGSASATAAAEVPAAARARTEAGAIAFLNYFVSEVNRGQMAPGTVDLFAISDESCISCQKLQGSLKEYVDNGWSVRQAPVKIADVALANEPTADRVIINFTYEQLPVTYYKGSAAQGKLKPATTKNAAAIRWVERAWEMYDMEEL